MKAIFTSRMNTKMVAVAVAVAAALGATAASASAFGELPGFENFSNPIGNAKQGGETIAFELPVRTGSTAPNVSCTKVELTTVTHEESVTPPKLFKESFHFSGCGYAAFHSSSKCSSAGAKEGEIQTPVVESRLYYLSKAKKEAGLLINYTKSGEPATFATFGCSLLGIGHSYTVRGTALAQMSPVNTKTALYTQTLTGANGIPTLTKYETEAGVKGVAKLEMKEGTLAWEAADLNAKGLVWSFVEAVELLA